MAIATVKELVDSHLDGRSRISTWRKSPTQVTTAGIWFDLSMSPGNPNPQYYAASPMIASQMSHSTDGGLFHGKSVSPNSKYLRRMTVLSAVATALPMTLMLLDYLLFYPFIDEGTTDTQLMDNTTSLTRYTDGSGVQIMPVSVAGRTGGQSFVVGYTNQDGVAGRQTIATVQNTANAVGHIVTSSPATNGSAGPFLPLQGTDTGVRSIQSVTMLGSDVGLFTLVLVRPLATIQLRDNTAPVEKDLLLDNAIMPVIQDDAYLNFICVASAALNTTALHGTIETVWG